MTYSLVDPYGRCIDYLRISITDLCNLRCVYCRPPQGVDLLTHEEILRYEEILSVVETARSMGIRKIRITGGEPLVRRGVIGFIDRLTGIEGIDDVGLTTNGALLTKMAEELRTAGLSRINISLDTLRRDTFAAITGTDKLADVLAGIERAFEVGFDPVKINVVLLAGINEPDVAGLAGLTMEKPLDVRFIERMPFGATWTPHPPESFSALKALEMIRSQVGDLDSVPRGPLDGPATMFRLKGAKGRIGIIDSVTGHFCGTCNRMRLTARGTLRPCLLSDNEIDIRSALRRGDSPDQLAAIILSAVNAKPPGNCGHRGRFAEGMNRIGG